MKGLVSDGNVGAAKPLPPPFARWREKKGVLNSITKFSAPDGLKI